MAEATKMCPMCNEYDVNYAGETCGWESCEKAWDSKEERLYREDMAGITKQWIASDLTADAQASFRKLIEKAVTAAKEIEREEIARLVEKHPGMRRTEVLAKLIRGRGDEGTS